MNKITLSQFKLFACSSLGNKQPFLLRFCLCLSQACPAIEVQNDSQRTSKRLVLLLLRTCESLPTASRVPSGLQSTAVSAAECPPVTLSMRH